MLFPLSGMLFLEFFKRAQVRPWLSREMPASCLLPPPQPRVSTLQTLRPPVLLEPVPQWRLNNAPSRRLYVSEAFRLVELTSGCIRLAVFAYSLSRCCLQGHSLPHPPLGALGLQLTASPHTCISLLEGFLPEPSAALPLAGRRCQGGNALSAPRKNPQLMTERNLGKTHSTLLSPQGRVTRRDVTAVAPPWKPA